MMFVDQRIYDYGLLTQFTDAAYLIGKYGEAYEAAIKLLANPRLPESDRLRMEGNLSFIKAKTPRVSIITSVWNGDLFIEGFLRDITKQTIFSQCELILINANSPGSEDAVIERYRKKYSNIVYVKLPFDPGLYGVWNQAIKMASAPFIANANLDDRNRIDCLEKQVEALELDPTVDLVYSAHYLTAIPNETFENNHQNGGVNPPEFSLKNMFYCLPGPRPMWRKSMHDRCGFFSELFSMAGDYEMWLRAVKMGAKFKKIPGIFSLVYANPQGLSTDQDPKKVEQRQNELILIAAKYSDVYGHIPPVLPPASPPRE
jgi:GT2 family glycosyltransferase